MSRFRRVVHGLASSYAILIAASLYSLASFPLALHYLSQERFALWVLMGSIGLYLSQIDLGMSSSVARLLIDHKDQRQGGAYGSLIKTGWLVLSVQGFILLIVGLVLAPAFVSLYHIEPEYRAEFIGLMRWQTTALALGLALRISSHLLYAHQRQDVMGYLQIGTLVLNFALLWIFFRSGQGVFSLAWASLISSIFGALAALLVCWRMRLFPPPGAWGRTSWQSFLEIFGYGKDLFLVSLGSQMITGTQPMIISRMLGPRAVVAWGVGTKAFAMISQVVCRLSDTAGPAISEMIVRREQALLRERYQALVILTASFSAFTAASYALCNSSFVTVWMHGRFAWPPLNDLLLASWMIALAIIHCHATLVVVTKEVGFMHYVFFVEGIVFISASLLVAQHGGLPAVILCSLLCSMGFSGAYTVWRISHFFKLPIRQVAFQWLAPMGRLLLLLVPITLVGWWSFRRVEPPLLRLILYASLCCSVCFYLFLRYGLTAALQRELLARAPKQLSPLLYWLFAGVRL
jgi:O-antigen/teichoic acid export membrane protein